MDINNGINSENEKSKHSLSGKAKKGIALPQK